MSDDLCPTTRRRLLRGASALPALVLAGCLGDDGGNAGDADGEDEKIEFDDEPDHDPGEYDVDVSELFVYDREHDEQVANSHAGHWHYRTEASGLPPIEVGSEATFDVTVTKGGEKLALESDGPYRLGVIVAEDAPDDVVSLAVEPARVTVTGEAVGETALVFQLLEDDALGWETPPIDVALEA